MAVRLGVRLRTPVDGGAGGDDGVAHPALQRPQSVELTEGTDMRATIGMAAFALLVAGSVGLAQAAVVSLPLDGATIEFPIDGPQRPISQSEPAHLKVLESALPATNRLVEVFYTPADLQRLAQGGVVEDIYYQVQVPRALESKTLGTADWDRLKRDLIAELETFDINAAVAADDGRGARISKAAGEDVEMRFGEIGKPRLVKDAPLYVTYGLVVPTALSIGGVTHEATMSVAAGTALLRNKVVYVFAYAPGASPAEVERLHADFDGTMQKLVTLNAPDASVPSGRGFDFRRMLVMGAVGAGIGVLVTLLLGWRRRRGA